MKDNITYISHHLTSLLLQPVIGDDSDFTHVSDVDDVGRASAASPPAVPSSSMRRSVILSHIFQSA